MLLPLGDDNRDRQITPVVNYLLIALNIFVFIYWQQFGKNIHFTFAYAAVPAEILSGHDIITSTEIVHDPVTGEAIRMPGLQPTPIPVFLTLDLFSFYARGYCPYSWKYVVFVDFWRQS